VSGVEDNAIINNVTMEEKIFKILLSYSAESKDLEQTHRELCDLFNVSDRFDDAKFIENCCISYRHDYGLLDEGTQGLIQAEVKEVMRAIKNNAPYGR